MGSLWERGFRQSKALRGQKNVAPGTEESNGPQPLFPNPEGLAPGVIQTWGGGFHGFWSRSEPGSNLLLAD